uniref:Uncharacterized protein AlNc14C419G11506 n=1 Tax=Albugo laibachii Nc14 TaxID=890382 RepID=F0WZ99_9STRA|nr:conserved hypothetical protein [Albugo laibachii Nc14]|eukprot:CCA26817.1 conserved hypothetical protein [Albugo laibachii Nc14]
MSIPTVQQLLSDVDELQAMLRSLDESFDEKKCPSNLEHAQKKDTLNRSHVPRSRNKVAALTRENVSRLRPFQHHNARKYSQAGSVSDSIQSHLSIRTDGGTVFSRLYQPDFYQKRDEKLYSQRCRNERFHSAGANMKPARRRSVLSSMSTTSFHSGACGLSAKTDCTNSVSSRLYDPDYLKKRSARLQRMKEEQELRECTFTPSIRPTSRNRLQI